MNLKNKTNSGAQDAQKINKINIATFNIRSINCDEKLTNLKNFINFHQ